MRDDILNEKTYVKLYVCHKMTFQSDILQDLDTVFEIIFKCMSGATTKNGKFIMPLKEKLSYHDSSDRCDGKGFAICLDVIKSYSKDKNVLTLS